MTVTILKSKSSLIRTKIILPKATFVWADKNYHPIFESNELEHHFGCPKQLGSHKSSSIGNWKGFSSSLDKTCVLVSEGEMTSIKLRAGDVIVVASDGLFDNLHGEEVTTLMNESKEFCFSPSLNNVLIPRKKSVVITSHTTSYHYFQTKFLMSGPRSRQIGCL